LLREAAVAVSLFRNEYYQNPVPFAARLWTNPAIEHGATEDYNEGQLSEYGRATSERLDSYSEKKTCFEVYVEIRFKRDAGWQTF
jgi:hypothetical protein